MALKLHGVPGVVFENIPDSHNSNNLRVETHLSAWVLPAGQESRDIKVISGNTQAMSLEAWLKELAAELVAGRWEIFADAMVADGFEPAYARFLLASAFVRYSQVPLYALPGTHVGDQAVQWLRGCAGELTELAYSLPAPLPLEDGVVRAPLQPSQIARHRLDLVDRQVRVLMSMPSPGIALFDNLLSVQECEALIALAQGQLERDTVVSSDTGEDLYDPTWRTSLGTTLTPAKSPVVAAVEQRAAELLQWPCSHFESMAISYYPPGALFRPHHDYFDPTGPTAARDLNQGGQRVATLVMYLNDVPLGGGTRFPDVGVECRPHRGAATYFTYQMAGGRSHPQSLHAGEPVLEGAKWIATLWLREREARTQCGPAVLTQTSYEAVIAPLSV